MKEAKILVVDDEEDILFTLKMLLKRQVKRVITESNPYHLPRLLRTHQPNLVLLDMNFNRGDTSGQEGLKWLAKIKELQPSTEVVIITAHGDVELAVRALKHGALDFVEKPWRNDKLLDVVESAIKIALPEENGNASSEGAKANAMANNAFIAVSPEMADTVNKIDKVSATDANILILGENGTGKEVAARRIHEKSCRSSKPFVKVDLGAIPDTLFESELFGHKKGAFTDAQSDRMGRLEKAEGGTLFLDEIGNLSLPSQSKLLSALQNRSITPLGGTQSISIDFRLVCATNMELHEMVKEQTFRQDLLYRINTVELLLPPLRERPRDIAPLAQHFLDIFKIKYNRPEAHFADEALPALERHSWPGNIRELRHTIERALILADSSDLTFAPSSLSSNLYMDKTDVEDSLNLEHMERRLIVRALKINQGNVSKAAKDLGITRGALYRRMEKYDV